MDQRFQPRVLLCATLWWVPSARLAMALLRQGCQVSAVCPPGHPLLFVDGIDAIYPYRGLSSVSSLRTALEQSAPDLVIPCDDAAVWQLHELHASASQWRPLIEYSLGPSEWYDAIQKRGAVLSIAEELGIRIPVTQQINEVEDLRKWQLGWPAVIKADGTWGGQGVVIARTQAGAEKALTSGFGAAKAGTAWKRFLVNRHPLALWSWRRHKESSLTLQQFIPGRPATTMLACWQGEVLASVTVEVLVAQGQTGAATVVRLIEHKEIDRASHLLAQRFQLSGFHGLDFMLEEETGAAYLIELNPRATQLGHLRLPVQGDLAGALAAKLTQRAPYPLAPENCIGSRIIAFFPQAWKADPASPYLVEGYHDVPWEEPALVREMMRDSWPDRRLLSRVLTKLRSRKPQSLSAGTLRTLVRSAGTKL